MRKGTFTAAEADEARARATHEVALAGEAASEAARRAQAAARSSVRVPPFAHLAVRSCWSMRDGAIRPRELTAAAAGAGMTHVALTDRDGLYGAVRFAKAAAADGVTPVFGTDLALAPDLDRQGWEISRAGRERHVADRTAVDPRSQRPGRGPGWLEDDAPRVTLLARTTAGYGDVCRAVTAAHFHEDRSSPHLAWEAAANAFEHDGTYAMLGADSPVGRLLARGQLDAAELEARRWLEITGVKAMVLGVRDHLAKGRRIPGPVRTDVRRRTSIPLVDGCDDTTLVRRTLELAKKLGVRAVATNDVRYLAREDVVLADVMACVRGQVPLGRRHLGRSTAEAFLTTPGEQLARFAERPDLLASAYEVAVSCSVDLALGEVHVPRLTGLSDDVARGELHRRSWEGVAERFPRVTPKIRERLERELAMIDRLGLWDYFLTVGDICGEIRALGIIAACRGSAAGSLICYALRISDVDPVAHDLAFERFMNPYRDELPDIDIDVESARREDVYALVLRRHGGDKTACVAMIETFQARSAIREVGKVLGIPNDELGEVAKSFTHARARDVRTAVAQLPELQRANLDKGQLDLLFSICERIDGFPRHVALHPCGILLADTRLTDRTPLQRSAVGHPMSQFDKDDVAALGMLKLDVLSVRMLSSIRHCLDLLPHTRGETLAFADIPGGDPDTFAMVRSAKTIGVFQIESPGQRELLGRLQPDDFGDLITEISLFRPGPVKADMVTPFVNRRHGNEESHYAHPALEPVLRETHGVVIYHEQVMGCLSVLTGCDLSYADLLRRQLSDTDKLPALKAWAMARALERGFDDTSFEAIWHQVASFASFGFCKAHAAAFAVPTYRSAYLKAHVLPEFFSGLLTHDPGMYPRRLILDEARQFGVAILPPDVNRSRDVYTVEVIDRGMADHILGIRKGHPPPPGWRVQQGRLVPPGGFDAGDAGDGWRRAIRVGLQDVKGMAGHEVEALLEHRPFTSLEDLRHRGQLSSSSGEALVLAGALDQVAGVGRPGGPRHRRDVLLAVDELWRKAPKRGGVDRGGGAQQIGLDLHADHTPQLPEPSGADLVRGELAALGMDVSRHVLSFYEPLLEHLGV
ncbi:MAG: error-prone DNA polymerase, partial [Glaciecola sp.]